MSQQQMDLIAYILPTMQQNAEAKAWQDRTGAPHPFRGAARAAWETQQEEQNWRQGYLGDVDRWADNRQGYYDNIQSGFEAAGRPGVEIAYQDALRNNALNMASRGMRHSSEDLAGQADAQLGRAQALGNLSAGGYSQVQAQMAADANTRQQMLGMGYNLPGQSMVAQQRLGQAGQSLRDWQFAQGLQDHWENFQRAPSEFQAQHLDWSLQQVGNGMGQMGANIGGWSYGGGGGATPTQRPDGTTLGLNPGGQQGALGGMGQQAPGMGQVFQGFSPRGGV